MANTRTEKSGLADLTEILNTVNTSFTYIPFVPKAIPTIVFLGAVSAMLSILFLSLIVEEPLAYYTSTQSVSMFMLLSSALMVAGYLEPDKVTLVLSIVAAVFTFIYSIPACQSAVGQVSGDCKTLNSNPDLLEATYASYIGSPGAAVTTLIPYASDGTICSGAAYGNSWWHTGHLVILGLHIAALFICSVAIIVIGIVEVVYGIMPYEKTVRALQKVSISHAWHAAPADSKSHFTHAAGGGDFTQLAKKAV